MGRQGDGNGGAKIRYAVVGLGHITQVAVLPAFEHARNSELVALVSSDDEKLAKLGDQWKVEHRVKYDEYDELLRRGLVDAVYIGLPNDLHREYTERTARAKVHVLCEKPMAVTEDECVAMIRACEDNGVKLMIAYRLHFERANMEAVEIARSGKLGELRYFESAFSQDVKPGDIRLQASKGGGTLYDIGVYCINAARYLFQDEPLEVSAFTESRADDPRFAEVDEMATVMLRFPRNRLATFVTSFGAAQVSSYRIVGTEGSLRVEPAYGYAHGLAYELTVGGATTRQEHEKRDQFAPELVHFSRCILEDRRPEPDGNEGLADVHIVRSAYRSAQLGHPSRLERFLPQRRPGLAQEMRRPPVDEPQTHKVTGPSGD